MGAYYLLIATPIIYFGISSMLSLKNNTLREKRTITVFFLFLLALLVLRDSHVGTDVHTYLNNFKSYCNDSWESVFTVDDASSEFGFAILNKLIGVISENEQFFLAVIAVITVLPVIYLYRRESEKGLLTIAVFLVAGLFPMYFSGLRQCIAIALMVPAYYFAKNKKMILFFLMIFIAFTFHKSALVALPLYFLYNTKITKQHIVLIVPIMGVLYVFNGRVFSFLLKFIGEDYSDRYGEVTSTGAYAMIVLFILFAVFSFLVVEDSELDNDTIGLRNLLLFSVCLQFFAPLHFVAMRMNYYYILFIPITLAKIVEKSKKNLVLAKLGSAVMICFFIAYFFYNAYTDEDALNVFPYIPCWLA